jgi:DNA polymerase-3 subunit alpha
MILPVVTTHYSLLKGFIKPSEVAKKCKDLGYSHCLIADIETISGVIDFFVEMKKVDVVPIIGMKSGDGYYVVKSLSGYRSLIRVISKEDTEYSNNDLEFISQDDLATLEVFYADKEDAILHRIALCSGFKTTLKKAHTVDMGEYNKFFHSDDYYFKKSDELSFSHDKIERTKKLISEIQDYSILSKPKLPKVDCGNMSEDEYLIELCRKGWRKKFMHLKGKQKEEYTDRVKYELSIINGFGLSGYFLIVYDILRYIRENGWLPGPGRGSAGGCLISYLLGITEIDPVKYDLLFSRFLNAGRFSKDNISLPDIDIDVPSKHRDQIIEYLKDKYSHPRVYQMITLGRLQGRSAIKEVARIYADLSFSELNELTESLPEEASISDELEEMEIKSVILWTLENDPKKLQKWCRIDSDKNIVGELSDLFDLAIRIEGTYKSHGKHPAGVIISNEDLINDAPLIEDVDGNKIVGFEMHDLDKVGLTKFDVLGVTLLDKIMDIVGETNE